MTYIFSCLINIAGLNDQKGMNQKQCKNGHLAETKLNGCSMHMSCVILFFFFLFLFSAVFQRLLYWHDRQTFFQNGQDKKNLKFARDVILLMAIMFETYNVLFPKHTYIKGTLVLSLWLLKNQNLKLNNWRKGEYCFFLIFILNVPGGSMKEWLTLWTDRIIFKKKKRPLQHVVYVCAHV